MSTKSLFRFGPAERAGHRPPPASRRRDRVPAWQAFFPLAAFHAALFVPLSLAAMHGWLPRLAPLAAPAGHARELLFGFALAVIAGYLLGPLAKRRLAALVALWLLGRLGTAGGGWLVVASLADALFAAAVAWLVVPRFFAAKKWRNRVLAPLVGLICLLAVATLGTRYLAGWSAFLLLEQGVLWLALLMAFMGGRLIAPAVNGYLKRRFNKSGAGVQPRLEAALIVLLGALPMALWLPDGRIVAALMAAVGGALVLYRLRGFAPWQCRARTDLLALMAGYAWLGAGLWLYAAATAGVLPMSTALHGVTVGALGSLASAVMLRQAVSWAKARPESERAFMPLALLFAAAAALRLGGGPAALWSAALCWSAAWLVAAWRLLRWISTTR
ncbi:NnrS family protein [Halomonas piscis]|uniref:NnrS family protein n=1 Tax=Halomonas piscis TaxID=3031727 RepID=UPI00289E3D46|nr:NnrS family protein [Halomonas piscis]